MKRKIVRIDQEKCNGCGLCVDACHEGAIQLIDGKAALVSDIYCDGLGDCLGECPEDAITIEAREADPFDPEAVKARVASLGSGEPRPSGCPGLAAVAFGEEDRQEAQDPGPTAAVPSALRQWPVQLHLVPVQAPYWEGADVLVSADCVAYAYGDFHRELLENRRLIIACPKLDDTSDYVEKLTAIFTQNDIGSATVAHMEVPCCTALVRMVQQAAAQSGKGLDVKTVKAGVRGGLQKTA